MVIGMIILSEVVANVINDYMSIKSHLWYLFLSGFFSTGLLLNWELIRRTC